MKKQILFTFLLISLTLFVSSQSTKLEKETFEKLKPSEVLGIEPKLSQGYLVLNPSKFEKLSYWKIKLIPKKKKKKNFDLHSTDKKSKIRSIKLEKK